jgi:hypothetical protein
VHVQVHNYLPGFAAGIDYQFVSLACPHVLGHCIDHLKHMNSHGQVLLIEISQGNDVLPGDDQDVDRGLGMDIFKGQDALILEYYVTRDFTGCYLAKNTIRHDGLLVYYNIFLGTYSLYLSILSGNGEKAEAGPASRGLFKN